MNIAITGASGFVGQNLLNYLKPFGYTIKLWDRAALQDIKLSLTEEIDIIVHLAGKAHDLKNVSDPSAYYDVNFQLTKDLYDVFLSSPAKKFIFISSVKAAADSLNEVLTEDFEPSPQTHYGKSKLLAENYILSALPNGKSVYLLRPCIIHGPGNKGNLNLLYKLVKNGIPYPLGAYENRRSFLSVENLCFSIVALIRQEVASGIYNVADDEAISTNQLVALIAEALDEKPKIFKVPKQFINLIGKFSDLTKLPLNSERIAKLTENYVVSNTKLKLAIGKNFPLDTKTGLIKTIRSMAVKD